MTFIVYGREAGKILDVFPGCWDDLDDTIHPNYLLWEFYHKQTGGIVWAYCISHDCEHNAEYKPDWYTRPEDR